MTTLKTQNGKYSSILANDEHMPITDVAQFARRWSEFTMGFFLNGKTIGSGTLEKKAKGVVHTDSVHLDKRFRRKGHGINLYIHLIETARKIGATRIYSSTSLNELSRRMWREKLKEIYDVKSVPLRTCSACGCKEHLREKHFYIDLRNK